MKNDEFEYIIADDYIPWKEVPNGFTTRVIPKHTWAVFPCKGSMLDSLQSANRKIFSEWLPNCKDYSKMILNSGDSEEKPFYYRIYNKVH